MHRERPPLPRAIIREAALKLAPVCSVAGAITAWPNGYALRVVSDELVREPPLRSTGFPFRKRGLMRG